MNESLSDAPKSKGGNDHLSSMNDCPLGEDNPTGFTNQPPWDDNPPIGSSLPVSSDCSTEPGNYNHKNDQVDVGSCDYHHQCDDDSCVSSHLSDNGGENKNEPHQNITQQLPFLHFHALECDHSGIEYIIHDHDITLRIPEGVVPVGESIKFAIGVVMYGPFIFLGNTRPISPIIWLCIQEDIELKKPFQLILPHFLIGMKKERLSHHQVSFAKANHSAYDIEEKYKFNRCAQELLFASTESRNYTVLNSTHCYFYCLTASNTPELARKAGYCLARIEAILSPQRSEVYFVACFFLKTCIKVLIIIIVLHYY